MCAPSVPKVEKTPVRSTPLLPNNGDPTIRATDRQKRTLNPGAMIFANKGGTLGAPSTTSVLGV